MRETIEEKADRLLATGKVRILRAGDYTLARVEGDHHVYAVRGSRSDPLTCECKAAQHHMRCSHLIAVELVTTERGTS